jgi:hypothetical protein
VEETENEKMNIGKTEVGSVCLVVGWHTEWLIFINRATSSSYVINIVAQHHVDFHAEINKVSYSLLCFQHWDINSKNHSSVECCSFF